MMGILLSPGHPSRHYGPKARRAVARSAALFKRFWGRFPRLRLAPQRGLAAL